MGSWRLALLAAAAAAVIGFFAGVATRDDAGTSGVGGQLSVASALLNYPPGWQLVDGPSRILGVPVTTTAALEPQTAAGRSGGRLIAGTLRGRTPADLPALLATGGDAIRSETVLLQGRRAFHLTGVRDGGRTLELFVLPVTLSAPLEPGLVTVACSAPAGAPRSFASACAGLAAGTTIVGVASGQELRPDARYAGRLDAALTRLDRERAAARGALRERRAAAYQAQDARRISAAAATAATSIAAASPPAPARRVNGAIVRELRATASAYTALAAAATARDAAAFSAAGRAVAGAEARTARALRGLTVLGYAGRR